MTLTIRDSRADDGLAILAIYNEVLTTSNAIYSETLGTLDYINAWREARIDSGFPLFVAEDEGIICGYATFGLFRARPGYRFTVEHTVHIASGSRGQGVGSALMESLIARARADSYHVMVGAIDTGNQKSIDFHKRLGFQAHEPMREVGTKGGNWLDLCFVTLSLDANAPE